MDLFKIHARPESVLDDGRPNLPFPFQSFRPILIESHPKAKLFGLAKIYAYCRAFTVSSRLGICKLCWLNFHQFTLVDYKRDRFKYKSAGAGGVTQTKTRKNSPSDLCYAHRIYGIRGSPYIICSCQVIFQVKIRLGWEPYRGVRASRQQTVRFSSTRLLYPKPEMGQSDWRGEFCLSLPRKITRPKLRFHRGNHFL